MGEVSGDLGLECACLRTLGLDFVLLLHLRALGLEFAFLPHLRTLGLESVAPSVAPDSTAVDAPNWTINPSMLTVRKMQVD